MDQKIGRAFPKSRASTDAGGEAPVRTDPCEDDIAASRFEEEAAAAAGEPGEHREPVEEDLALPGLLDAKDGRCTAAEGTGAFGVTVGKVGARQDGADEEELLSGEFLWRGDGGAVRSAMRDAQAATPRAPSDVGYVVSWCSEAYRFLGISIP